MTTTAGKRTITFSSVTNLKGVIGKRVWLDEDGLLQTETEARLYDGCVEEIEVSSLSDFLAARASARENQSFVYGSWRYPKGRVVTQRTLDGISAEQRATEKIMARDGANVSWSDCPSIMMFDMDANDAPPEILERLPAVPEAWYALLCSLLPIQEHCVPVGWAVSGSSCLYNGETKLRGQRGQRVYLPVECGLDIPRIVETVRAALVLEGLVWFQISKSGQLLERLPFDFAVYRPEHLDFVSPICEAPVTWRPPRWKIWNDGAGVFPNAAVRSVSREDARRVADIIAARKRERYDEAAARRKAWAKERAEKIAEEQDIEVGAAQSIVSAAVERGVLLPDFPLIHEDGAVVLVGELIANPAAHHLRRFHDPLEPDYRDDPRIAVFLGNGQTAIVHSHAHGGQKFRCVARVAKVRVGQLNTTVDAVVEELQRDPGELFRSGTAFVRVIEDGGAAALQTLDDDGLALVLQQQIECERLTKSGFEPADLPPRAVRSLRREIHKTGLRHLTAVVDAPYCMRDGTIIDEPGYDPATRVLYAPGSVVPPRVRRGLSIRQAEDALRQLWHPFSRYPFKDDVARGVVLSAALTAVCRVSLDRSPGFAFVANSAGTGKTILAQALGALMTGEILAVSAFPQSEDEMRKHIFARLRAGDQCMLLDNAERGSEVKSSVLAAMLTADVIEDRVLGISVSERWPNRLTFMLTGNNVQLYGDLNRRFLRAEIQTDDEVPWAREFPFHPVRYVLAHRLALRTAALEIIGAWVAAGAPKSTGLGSFEEWDDLVRSVVVWVSQELDIGVGFADPVGAIHAAYEEDPEIEDLASLLAACHQCFGEQTFSIAEMVKRSEVDAGILNPQDEDEDRAARWLREAINALHDPRKDMNRSMAAYVKGHLRRPVAGLRFMRSGQDAKRKTALWRVEVVDRTAFNERWNDRDDDLDLADLL